MTVHLHRLDGCAPAPLAHYLKALGVLRLVSEQADPGARGFWKAERFTLVTTLERAELTKFLLERYQPTPIVAPWNGGSGFYPKDNADAIDPLSTTKAPRFAALAAAIRVGRELVIGREKSPKDEEKAAMVAACRATWSGGQLAWLNAAVVLAGAEVRYPALLGTGGNDGRLDFTNNFMQRLVELFDPGSGAPTKEATSWLGAALFGTAADGLLQDKAIGQFLPGSAGGANSTRGYSGQSLINPWDFVLMLEGAPLFAVAAVRRLEGTGVSQAAAPFAVRAQGAGYASATTDDESARGEQWFPLWSWPSTLGEVQGLMREGRMQTGRSPARNAVDAVRAFARLGTARGVDAFVRFGYIERNGQSNLAVPLGTWSVTLRPEVRLIDDIDPWVDSLRRAAADNQAPIGLGRLVRRIEDDILNVCREPGLPANWQTLLARLGTAEDELVRRPRMSVKLRLQPLPRLAVGWRRAADDGSPEFRVAIALATQRATGARHGWCALRQYCAPIDLGARWARFAANSQALATGPDQVWTGRDLASDLAAIVIRRVIGSARGGVPGLALRPEITAPLAYVARFVDGALDDQRIAGLARAMMALEPSDSPDEVDDRSVPDAYEHADAAHGLFRLLYLPDHYHLIEPVDDPTPLRLLMAGRFEDASQVAVRRLVGRGSRPKVAKVIGTADLGRRIVAALAIPISLADARLIRSAVCAPERGRTPLESAKTREPLWRDS